ncbi:hypothetical protein ABZW10_05990 [Kitasatospora sp. NPDC004723]|uniref:hypothetical protein n=1 Tax=Kitasatospora sp. NPDC004723 TaxID=3154288 RepID=UPI0033B9067C
MEKTRTAALAVAAGVVPAALGLGMGWPAWLWSSASAAVVAVVLLTSVARVRPEVPPVVPPPQAAAPVPPYIPPPVPEPPVEQPFRSTSVTGVALPSAVPDYDFLFSATVWFRELGNPGGVAHAAPGSLAIDAVLARARAVTEREHPGRPELVRHQLDGVLGTPSPDGYGIVVAMAGQVGLELPEADRRRLEKLAEVRKAEEIWEQERRYERSKRTYLGEDVLKTPGSAVVWWLSRNDEEVRGAVDMIGPLAQLAAAANDQAVDLLYEHLVAPAAGRADEVPFLNGVAPMAAAGGGSAGAPGPVFGGEPVFGPVRPQNQEPSVIGPLNNLMRDIKLAQADEQKVYAHRVARITEAAGRPEEAARIRATLGDDDGGAAEPSPDAAPPDAPGGVPGQRVFVVGPVQPQGGGEAESGPVTSAWEVLRGSVNGDPRGAGGGTEEGWGGADQSHE